MKFLSCLLLFCSLSCGGINDDFVPKRMRLITDNEEWLLIKESEDPFRDLRPDGMKDCDFIPFILEENALEIDTKVCNFVTVYQPLLENINEGDEITLEIFHRDLWDEQPGTATLIVAISKNKIWEEKIKIPKKSDFLTIKFKAEDDFEKGTPIYFHVNNHGFNNYKLLGFYVYN